VADSVSKIDYYSVVIPHQCGEGAKLLGAFKDAGVNFVGMWAYPIGEGKAKIDFSAEDNALAKKVARKLKLELGPKQTAFYVYGKDRKGAVADVLSKLAAAGVNVRALQAGCAGPGRFGAFIQLENPADVKKAAKALGL
jgi:hypothetical protein